MTLGATVRAMRHSSSLPFSVVSAVLVAIRSAHFMRPFASPWVLGPRAAGTCLRHSSAMDPAHPLRHRFPGWRERSHGSCSSQDLQYYTIGPLRSSSGGHNIPFGFQGLRCSHGPTLICMSSCSSVAGDLLLSSVMCKRRRRRLPTPPGLLQRSLTALPCSHILTLLRQGLLSWRYCRPLWTKFGQLLQTAFVAKAFLYITFAPSNWPISLVQRSVRPHLQIGGLHVAVGVTEKPAVSGTQHCCQVSDTALFDSLRTRLLLRLSTQEPQWLFQPRPLTRHRLSDSRLAMASSSTMPSFAELATNSGILMTSADCFRQEESTTQACFFTCSWTARRSKPSLSHFVPVSSLTVRHAGGPRTSSWSTTPPSLTCWTRYIAKHRSPPPAAVPAASASQVATSAGGKETTDLPKSYWADFVADYEDVG